MQTTVAVDYVAGSGTLVVADATGMPATGTFRLRLANAAGTLLRVDSRAGATLTVTPDQDDGNAAVGVAVTLVVTAEAMLQLKADAGGGGGFPGYPTIVPLDQSAWTWVNQGGAAIVQADGVVYLTGPTQAGRNNRSRVVAAPATPYTITALINPGTRTTANDAWSGLVFRESSTSKLIMFIRGATSGGTLAVLRETNDTTNASTAFSQAWALPPWQPIWLRITDDGTNLVFSISFDGRNFIQLHSELRGAFFTATGFPNQIGIVTGAQGTGAVQEMSVLSWAQT